MSELLKTVLLVISGLVLLLFFIAGLNPLPAAAPTYPPPALLDTSNVSTTTETVVAPTPINIEEKPTKPAEQKESTPSDTIPAPSVQTKIQETIDTISQALDDLKGQELPSNITSDYKGLNETVRGAIVNIICTTEGSGPLNPISASGVVIDPRGVIITNAHVGQYFLLKDYPSPGYVDCSIRTGSPARPAYTAELMFLPPSWITANAQKIKQDNPTGNGDHDYALILITGTGNAHSTLPNTFPYLHLSTIEPVAFAEVLLAGYPAGFLGGITILKDLYAASSVAKVGDLYTFVENTLDLFSIGGSVVAQQGSSGGAVASRSGELMGLIVTSSDATDTASRDLRALAATYIRRDFERESGKTLSAYLAGNLTQELELFRIGTAPTLTQSLVNALKSQ